MTFRLVSVYNKYMKTKTIIEMGIATAVLLGIVGVLTYIAVNVTMDIHGAGMLVCGFVIFGSLALGFLAGFIASFFEEAETN